MLPSEDDLEQWNLDLLEEFGWGTDVRTQSSTRRFVGTRSLAV